MCMKEFKQRLNKNRGLSVVGEKSSSVIDVTIKENLVVKVDRNTIKANEKDLIEYVKDIITMKKNLSKGQIISLSSVCDCMYDLEFIGAKSVDDSKIVYMRIC